MLWINLRRAGYTRTIQGLYHAIQRLGIYEKTMPNKKKKSEPLVLFPTKSLCDDRVR